MLIRSHSGKLGTGLLTEGGGVHLEPESHRKVKDCGPRELGCRDRDRG